MDKIKEQFGEITKEVRQKNNLSQEDMAEKLYLSGKQTIYYYEKGKRIMKLPEFVDFIQQFNETVVIDKDGMSLVKKEFDTKNYTVKENKGMTKENNLKLIETKGDVVFYENTSTGKLYQKVEGLAGILKVEDGAGQYITIKQFGDVKLRYNLNGVYGYSIWMGDRCYEDRYWDLDQIEEDIKEMFLESQKKKAISVMCSNVENKLEDEELDLSELDFENADAFLDSLDDVFGDGGEFRCEGFTDMAMAYALSFGELESEAYTNAKWECIDKAFEILKEESIRSVTCKDADYPSDEMEMEYEMNNDGKSYKITLLRNNKQLLFKRFYFGYDEPELKEVMQFIEDDYRLYKLSPTLSDYSIHRGDIEGLEDDYKFFKLDIKEIIKFFGKSYLENLL